LSPLAQGLSPLFPVGAWYHNPQQGSPLPLPLLLLTNLPHPRTTCSS
jgi:hypothetical protein